MSKERKLTISLHGTKVIQCDKIEIRSDKKGDAMAYFCNDLYRKEPKVIDSCYLTSINSIKDRDTTYWVE